MCMYVHTPSPSKQHTKSWVCKHTDLFNFLKFKLCLIIRSRYELRNFVLFLSYAQPPWRGWATSHEWTWLQLLVCQAGCIPVMWWDTGCEGNWPPPCLWLPVWAVLGRVNVKLNTTPTNTFSPPHDPGKLSLILCLFTPLLTWGRGFLVSSGGNGKSKRCYKSLFSQ